MKYFFQLILSILFLLGSSVAAYFLWPIEPVWEWKAFLILGPVLSASTCVRFLLIYAKIDHQKNKLRVSSLFSTKVYDLNELTSWTNRPNPYDIHFRVIKLTFLNSKLTLFDHADPAKVEQFYHYLRTHHDDQMISP